jgi:anti-sigma-K factor RskA
MSATKNGDDHERFGADAAAYALDALEATEVRQFEEHLARCDACQRELAAMRAVVEALPAAAPAHAARPELKGRVMATVRADARQQAPGSKDRARRAVWRIARPRLAASAITAAAAAAAALAIALVSGGGGSGRTFVGVVSAPGASASVHESGSSAQLRVSRVPGPPPGRIYEVWLQRGAGTPEPTSALFSTGTGSVTLPSNLRGVQAVLVTAEPRPNGSRKPTRAPTIVVGLT